MPFIPFSCLNSPTRTSIIILSRKETLFFTFKYLLILGFLRRCSLSGCEHFLLIILLLKGFFLSNDFSASICIIMVFLKTGILQVALINFLILNQPYIFGMNSICSWCIIEDFYIFVYERCWSIAFFFIQFLPEGF